MAIKDKMYRVRCRSCGKAFTVPGLASPVPTHPIESKGKGLGIYLPCPGSSHSGIPIGTVYQ